MLKQKTSVIIFTIIAAILVLFSSDSASAQVLISQIQVTGASSTDEFVELFNNTSTTQSLSGWSLKKQTASGSQYSLVSSFPSSALINPFGYFLIGHRDYSPIGGILADHNYSNNSNSLADNNSILLNDDSGNLIDKVDWQSIPAGQSLTRLPNNDTGNWQDTGSPSDFVLKNSSPKNSGSAASSGGSSGALGFNLDAGSDDDTIVNGISVSSTASTETIIIISSSSTQTSQDNTTAVSASTTGSGSTLILITSSASSSNPIWSQLQLSEIVPNPSAGEEWVELYNPTTSSLNLTGGTLCDNRTACAIASPTGTIPALGWVAIYLSGSKLNNDGDSVILKNPEGGIVDQIIYGKTLLPNKGEALARDENSNWVITTAPSPGIANTISPPLSKALSPVLEYSAPLNSVCAGIGCSSNNGNNSLSSSNSTTQTFSSTSTTTSSSTFSTFLILSELFPNPVGPDSAGEFIEIKNQSQNFVTIDKWKISDSAKSYTFSATIMPGGYFVLSKAATGISLNNSTSETVTLLNENGAIVDQIKYDKAIEGQSYSRGDDNKWDWTENITRGSVNIFSETSNQSPDTEPSASTSPITNKESAKPQAKITKKTSAQFLGNVSLAVARETNKGSLVTVKGVVTALPGTFGRQFFYISDNDGGIEIFQSKKQFPQLALGDYVRVRGTVSSANGIQRINVKNVNDIITTPCRDASQCVSTTTLYAADEITEDALGQLITVKGEITSIRTNYIYLDDGSAEIAAYFKQGAKINKQNFKLGDNVEVTGILELTKSGFQIWPRSNEDIKVLGLSPEALKERAELEAKESAKLKKEYGAVTAGGLTTVILAWVARARGAIALKGVKRVGVLAVGIIKKNKI